MKRRLKFDPTLNHKAGDTVKYRKKKQATWDHLKKNPLKVNVVYGTYVHSMYVYSYHVFGRGTRPNYVFHIDRKSVV